MKLHTLCAMTTALAWGVEAMSSNTRGVRGQHHAPLLRDFQNHRELVPEHDVGPMLKSAEAMLMDLASRGGGTPLADLVAEIRPFILQMQDSITTAHNSAQQILTNFASDFSGCVAARSTGEAEAASLQNTKTGHSNNHKACRTAEKAAHDQHSACESNMDNLQEAKDSSCQLYANAARAPGCDGIPPNPGETWKSYVTRAATWFENERDSYLHKEAVCNNDTARLEAQTTTCRGSDGSGGQQKEHEDKKEECDSSQNHLETTTCAYVIKVDETCESFASCTNTIADGYEAQLTGIQTLEQQRKVEWHTTDRLLCLLGAYGADGSVDATKLQTCQNIGENTTHLNLVYPTGTTRPDPCPDLLPHPCEADYLAQEYGGLDASAKDCTPCALPGGGGAPSPSGGGGAPSPSSGGSSPSPPISVSTAVGFTGTSSSVLNGARVPKYKVARITGDRVLIANVHDASSAGFYVYTISTGAFEYSRNTIPAQGGTECGVTVASTGATAHGIYCARKGSTWLQCHNFDISSAGAVTMNTGSFLQLDGGWQMSVGDMGLITVTGNVQNGLLCENLNGNQCYIISSDSSTKTLWRAAQERFSHVGADYLNNIGAIGVAVTSETMAVVCYNSYSAPWKAVGSTTSTTDNSIFCRKATLAAPTAPNGQGSVAYSGGDSPAVSHADLLLSWDFSVSALSTDSAILCYSKVNEQNSISDSDRGGCVVLTESGDAVVPAASSSFVDRAWSHSVVGLSASSAVDCYVDLKDMTVRCARLTYDAGAGTLSWGTALEVATNAKTLTGYPLTWYERYGYVRATRASQTSVVVCYIVNDVNAQQCSTIDV